jgi:hypothetical protein
MRAMLLHGPAVRRYRGLPLQPMEKCRLADHLMGHGVVISAIRRHPRPAHIRTLARDAMHGYTVARTIKERSKNVFLIEEGAPVPRPAPFERQGWVESEWDSENNRKAVLPAHDQGPRVAASLAGMAAIHHRPAGALQPA